MIQLYTMLCTELQTFDYLFYFRSKSCKKDLWAQINTALQANTKWQRSDLGTQGSFSYHRTQLDSVEELEIQPSTPPCIHLCNFTSTEVAIGHPIFLAHATPLVSHEVFAEHQPGAAAWFPCANDSSPPNSWLG